MVQGQANGPISFIAALAYAVVQYEEASSDPNFRSRFMVELDEAIEHVIRKDQSQDGDTRAIVERARRLLGQILVDFDLLDAIQNA